MNPDVVTAIARLRADRVLSVGQATLFDRVARRHLVSVRFEIRTLLYVGVLLLTSGVGLVVAQHHRELGPWVVAASIGLAAAACFSWVIRKAPPFAWHQVSSPSVAFDYVLLLGLLLFASGLAYVEGQFTLLGTRWAHHLLVVGAVYLIAAYRWDSQLVLGLALATLAAWRGVSVSLLSGSLWAGDARGLRSNAIVLGGLYVTAAAASVRLRRKPHFEEIFANAGLLLLFGALVAGALARGSVWAVWVVALLGVASVVVWVSFRVGRSLYFAQAVLAAYIGFVRLVFALFGDDPGGVPLFLSALLGVGAIMLIFAAHRRMSGR